MFQFIDYTLLKFKIIRFYLFIFLIATILTGCPADRGRKEARIIYQNKMNFDFKKPFKINYNGLYFMLPKKFSRNYGNYEAICANGSDCRSFSFEELSLYFGVSEIKEDELSNILFIHDMLNPLDAVLQDAGLKRKESMLNANISQINSINGKLSCKMLTVIETFKKWYTYQEDYSSLYYIAAVKKNNRYYIIQFSGKKDKMQYFMDDFKRILRSVN